MATYNIQKNQINEFVINAHKIFKNYDEISYENKIISSKQIHELFLCELSRKINNNRLFEIMLETVNKNIMITPISAKKMLKAEQKGKLTSFLEKYNTLGLLKYENKDHSKCIESLTKEFQKEKRFHGRIPGILPEIAAVCDIYNISETQAVSKFTIQSIRNLLDCGLSKMETALLYIHLNEAQISAVSQNLYIAQMVSTLLDKGLRKNNQELISGAYWIANHANTDLKLLKKVYNNAKDLILNEQTTIDNIKVQFNNEKAFEEVKKIEKAYKKPGFKLKNCICELRKSTSLNEQYEATILEGNDPRQVMLGYETECCQHLGEAGESAMMHGLLHPKAGFWVLTKRNSGKVVAQAECWEADRDTLVFDNIEFANDAEINQYKEIIGTWVEESPYTNIIMGCGYNELISDDFEEAGRLIPSVTPYEIYVVSYEKGYDDEEDDGIFAAEEFRNLESEEKARELLEAGRITYYDYIYCDSEGASVYLKHNGRVSEYFENELEQNDYERE